MAVSAVIVGSGGRRFFEVFRAAAKAAGSDPAPNPLDRYTRATVLAAVDAALTPAGVAYRVLFPFLSESPVLPFQRLGRAAGLGPPGPLGLQIHPEFGPWWAYRALVVLAAPLSAGESRDAAGDGCAGCDAPCVAACPAGAVLLGGFSVPACHTRRLQAPECQLSCAARIRCVRGPQHRYSEDQLAFHMAASMPRPPSR
jgi:hypothetical protein